jgi:signal transduction histidine kinase
MAGELEETDRARRNFIADASHELRTPIAAARAVLENMVDGVEPSDPSHLRPVLGQIERLGRLVDQLLDLSRLESGAAPLVAERVDLARIVDDVVRATEMIDPDVAVTVESEPTIVLGDPDRLRQVVTNLVDNARRFAPQRSPITVQVREEGGRAELSVEDRGPGIALDARERVFERFARDDRARARADGGAGLGLAIVKWIVEQHHGVIRVADVVPGTSPPTSPLGPGCRMVVTLPLAVA